MNWTNNGCRKLTDWLATLTNAQISRFYHEVWSKITEGDGYQPFGYDFRTLKINHPGLSLVLQAIHREVSKRKPFVFD